MCDFYGERAGPTDALQRGIVAIFCASAIAKLAELTKRQKNVSVAASLLTIGG